MLQYVTSLSLRVGRSRERLPDDGFLEATDLPAIRIDDSFVASTQNCFAIMSRAPREDERGSMTQDGHRVVAPSA
jgi:hypothetical protein